MTRRSQKEIEFEKFYNNSQSSYQRLEASVKNIIERELVNSHVLHLPPVTRIKTLKSCVDKIKIKNYPDPITQITDTVGLRIVVYLDSDIKKTEDAVRRVFRVLDNLSVDKRTSQHINHVGYRSIHLICCLGATREDLPEYNSICNINFEVQIRTALEHTWAEIEHKKNYKTTSGKSLPTDLQRRLMVLAGALELIDRELSNIASAADEYANEVSESEPSTLDDSISILSLAEILKKIRNMPDGTIARIDFGNLDLALLELGKFGIISNRDLEELLVSYANSNIKSADLTTEIGYIRDAMIHRDAKKYFENAYDNSFGILLSDLPSMTKIMGQENICDTRNILEDLGIEIINAYEEEDPDILV